MCVCDALLEKTVDILSEPGARDAMKAFSMWPTFPQLYVEGEFFGGCDIICEMYKCGELQELVERINLEEGNQNGKPQPEPSAAG